MEDFETLSVSDSFELQQNLTTLPSLKGSVLSQVKQGDLDEKLLGIISCNLYKDADHLLEDSMKQNLRAAYSELKARYISSEKSKSELEAQLAELIASATPCHQCDILANQNKETKSALEEAIQLSHMLLAQVHALSDEK